MIAKIERLAELSVARACGFAGIGIGTFMIGMITDPPLALLFGGILVLLTSLVLILKAMLALERPYKHTELWLMLDKTDRPLPALAQRLIGRALREVYLRFAFYGAVLACALIFASVAFRMLPQPS